MKSIINSFAISCVCSLFFSIVTAQGYISYATNTGSSSNLYQNNDNLRVVDGDTLYVASVVYKEDVAFPTTDGSSQNKSINNNTDIGITKHDENGKVVFSTIVGGDNTKDVVKSIKLNNGIIHVVGYYERNGGLTPDFLTTDLSTASGLNDGFYIQLDAYTGAIIFSTIIGGGDSDDISHVLFDNDDIFLVGSTRSSDFYTTDNSVVSGVRDLFVMKLDENNNQVFSKLYGGSGGDSSGPSFIKNGDLHLVVGTNSTDFPVTHGSYMFNSVVYVKLDVTGNVLTSFYVYEGSTSDSQSFYYEGNSLYFIGGQYDSNFTNFTFNNSDGTSTTAFDITHLIKTDETGNVQFATSFEGFDDLTYSFDSELKNNFIYVLTGCSSVNYRKYDLNGQLVYTSPSFGYGCSENFQLLVSESGEVHIASSLLNSSNTTDGSSITGGADIDYVKFDANDELCFKGFLGGNQDEDIVGLSEGASGIYAFFKTENSTTPYVTSLNDSASLAGGIYKINFCSIPTNTSDTLAPKSQFVCELGVTQKIVGQFIGTPGDSLSLLYEGTTEFKQSNIAASYQWQEAIALTGVYTDIPGATQQNFLPSPTAINRYYRRVARSSRCCGDSIISISDTASVVQSGLIAPIVDAGDLMSTCPNTYVTLGGSPSASGGLAPYSYSWNDGAYDSIANPDTTFTKSSIVTLSVTDDNGCTNVDQITINVYKSEAGSTRYSCAGDSVRIGGAPIAGLPGVAYSWTPSTGLSCTDCAQPLSSTLSTIIYSLETIIPLDGGGTCSSTDIVRVYPQEAPFNLDFAGADVTTCFENGSVTTGDFYDYPFELGVWAPASNLSSTTTDVTTYTFGSSFPPARNPAVYTKTLYTEQNCYFYDTVEIRVIHADAGDPSKIECLSEVRIGGNTDDPRLNETFQWTKVSGVGNFIGATNVPNPLVTRPTSGATIYALEVSLDGVICRDTIEVENCVVPVCNISILNENECPNVDLGPVSLEANFGSIPENYTYSWSPSVGLSNNNGKVVELLSSNEETYTVTITHINDPSITCQASRAVNESSTELPLWEGALDTVVCSGEVLDLGRVPVASYSYEWSGVDEDSLSDKESSNPQLTSSLTTEFYITVTDVVTGCKIVDTSSILVQNPVANAGKDIRFCDLAVVTLGTKDNPGYTYRWEPVIIWENGTDSSFAQPEATVATDLEFRLFVTDTLTGCSTSDTMQVIEIIAPAIPDAPDVSICEGIKEIIGSPAIDGATYLWSPSVGLSCANCAQPFANPSNTTNYTVSVTYPGSCPPVTDEVLVTVNKVTFPPMNDINYCPSAGAFNLGADAPAGMDAYSWSPYSTIMSHLERYNQDPITTTTPPVVETTIELTVEAPNGCFKTQSLKLIPSLAPNAGQNVTQCLEQGSVQIGSGSNPTGVGITYSWSPTTGLDDSSSPNPSFTPTAAGNNIFTLTKTEGGCTTTDKVTVLIKAFDLPMLPSQTICNGACAEIGNPGGLGDQFFWTASPDITDLNVGNHTVCPTSTTTYEVLGIGLNGCQSTKSVTVIVSPAVAPVIGLTDVVACQNSSLTMSPVVTPVSTDYTYSWSPNNGFLSNVNIANPIVSTSSTGMLSYSLTVTNTISGCSNSEEIDVDIRPLNNMSISAGDDQSLCSVTLATLDGDVPSSATIGTWEIDNSYAQPSTVTFTDASQYNTTVSGLVEGTYQFVWLLDNGSCTPASDTVSIRVSNQPIAAAGSNIALCNTTSTNLNAVATIGTSIGSWSVDSIYSQPSTPIFTDSSLFNSAVSNLVEGIYKLVWNVDNGTCNRSTDTMLVTVYGVASANAGLDQSLCPTDTVVLDGASVNAGGIGYWNQVSGPSTIVFADSSAVNTGLNVVSPGVYIIDRVVSFGGACPAVSDQVMITIASNCAPNVVNENETTAEDTPLVQDSTNGILGNGDVDPDGDILSVVAQPISDPEHGEIIINTDGSYTYTPDDNYNGNDTVIVSVCDNGNAPICINDTLFIVVIPVNDAPSQGNENETTSEETPITNINLELNNVDPESDSLVVTVPTTSTGGGTVTQNINGTIDYTPAVNFNGVDTVFYTVCDTVTPTVACVSDTLFITVTPINDDPAQGNESDTTAEDIAITNIDLTINNIDVDGDSLIVTVPPTSSAGGTVVQNPDGTIDYTPSSNFNGLDTIFYTVCDTASPTAACVSDTMFITVTPVNDGASQGNETETTSEETPITDINLELNNTDPENDSLIVNVPTMSSEGGTVVQNPDGTIDYTPLPNFNGVDTLIYTVCDTITPTAACITDTLFIIVTPINDDPTQGNENETTLEDTPITDIDLTLNNIDVDGDSLIVTVPTTSTEGGVVVHNPDGTIDYTPVPNFNGLDTIFYTVCDTATPNPSCVSDTLFIIVTPVNDAPEQGNEVLTGVNQNDTDPTTSVGLTDNNTDVEGDSLYVETIVSATGNGTVTVNSDNTVDYMPSTGFSGIDTVIYTVCDKGVPQPACVNDTLFIEVEGSDLIILDGFSPNGDGVNDNFVVRGLDKYPNNKLAVFNRWGNRVYKAENYQNDWDGTNQFGIKVGGNELPVGTYFYIIDLGDESEVLKGYIYLSR